MRKKKGKIMGKQGRKSKKSDKKDEKWRNLERKWSEKGAGLAIGGVIERENATGREKVKRERKKKRRKKAGASNGRPS